MSEEPLHFERLGPVARITLNRPRAMNALNAALVAQLEAAVAAVAADDDVRVLVLTGAGPAFCAGADLKDALEPPKSGQDDFLTRAGNAMKRLAALPKPVIAALNGITMAGGLELAMCADIVIAAEDAKIGDAHSNFGVYPGAGGAAVLPRVVPLHSALYLLYTGRTLPARRWYELGFVSELHPAADLPGAALELANALASKSPSALRRMKEVARASGDKSRADALLHEQVMLRQHLLSADFQEGLRAFAEKRPPRFTGR